ncbi:unnamed protein product, partial [marine sediment metagenome]
LVVFIVGITALLSWDYYVNGGTTFFREKDTSPEVIALPTPTDEAQPDVRVELPAYMV